MKIRADHQSIIYETTDKEIFDEIVNKFEQDQDINTKLKEL